MSIGYRGNRPARWLLSGVLVVLWTLVLPGITARAQEPPPIEWIVGPAKVPLGTAATLEVPAGYRFTGAAGAKTWMEVNGNPGFGPTLGVLIPPFEQLRDEETSWYLVFSFDQIGYVQDGEKEALSGSGADAILAALSEGTHQANQERKRRGWSELLILGWYQAPFYDSVTHHLTWATRASSAGREIINYDSRVLGRRGVMQVKMVVSPTRVDATVPTFRMILSGLSFTSGESYAEFRAGDKVAAYGLAALITGGTAVAATKLWKPLLALGAVIVAAVGAGLRKIKAFFTPLQPASAPAGPQGPPNPDVSNPAAAVVNCPKCGQANRVVMGRIGATCGQCGQTLN